MRFLRMLTNSLLAGALGAAYLTILILQLNPHVPLASATPWRWFATFGLFYGVHLAALIYALLMVREFFSLDALSPGWASVRLLAWLSAVLAAGAALLMWQNVSGFELVLGETAARRMRAGAAAASASAAVLLGIAVAHYSFGRRGSRVGAALFVMAVFGSLALPLAARGPAERLPHPPRAQVLPGDIETSGRRVMMLLLDGASLEFIWARAAEGRLPNFARLLETGASLDLATIRPTGPSPVWATVATGLYPARTGVKSGATYHAWRAPDPLHLLPSHCFSHALVHLGAVRQQPETSAAWRARPLWDIVSSAGLSVVIVRWPLTYPAAEVTGAIVSDRYHEVPGSIMELDEGVAYPTALLDAVHAAFTAAQPDPIATLAQATGVDDAAAPERTAAARDQAYGRVFRLLRDRATPRLAALRYQGLDTVGHYYMGDTQPGVVGDSAAHDRRRHVQVLDRYYGYIDAEIGAVASSLGAGDLLLVVSGFGMQRQHALKQIAARALGDPDLTGTHDRAPDGFLLAYGTDVKAGRQPRGSIVDVAPTVLYYLGLPVGRDMDGFARTDIFTREFTAERPIAFVPSYNR